MALEEGWGGTTHCKARTKMLTGRSKEGVQYFLSPRQPVPRSMHLQSSTWNLHLCG
jgi:hypothetical protein